MIQVSGVYENGQIRLLSPIHKKKANVIVMVLEDDNGQETVSQATSSSKRIPGLNKGAYFMADDFDEPLSDAFWSGEE